MFNFILPAIESLPNVPSILISAIEYVRTSIGNDIVVSYDNQTDRRKFRIEPNNDTYMNWAEYPTGGYLIGVFINKDISARRDVIEVDFYADLKCFTSNKRTFIVGTDTGTVSVDLADY